jgi:L,D-transpeptidase ErfK/SrfK
MITAPRLLGRRFALGSALGAMAFLAATPGIAAEFQVSPNDKVVGNLQDYVIQQGDVLADVARKFDIGYTEFLAANPGVDPWVPRAGTRITIPSLYILPDVPRRGIVMNLGERRLYYFPADGGPMQTYPIGIGAIGFDTPHSTKRVVRKEPNPTWIPTASIREEEPGLPAVVGPGPDNPLGDYALRLGWNNYLIHGTNKPDGVGRNVSHGCIHLYPEDIEKLFNSAAVGTPVRVIDQQADAAWMGIGLYVEVHPSKDQADAIDIEQAMTPEQLVGLREQVSAAAGDYAQAVDWNAAGRAAYQRTGLPVQVAMRPPSGPMADNAAPYAATSGPAATLPAASALPPPDIASGPTPIYHTLKPPPEMAQGPHDASGIVSQPLSDPDNEGPIRLLPSDMTSPNSPAGYDAASDPTRPAWDHGGARQ